jgi:murein DD-endopeptidase MepM/ murein hydrolase activator NlpD
MRRGHSKRTSKPSHSGSLLRFGAIAVFAGLGAGCSADAVRLTDPIFTSSTANQQAIVSGQANYRQPVPPHSTNAAAAQPGTIQRQTLPEPTAQAYQPVRSAPVQTAALEPRNSAPRPYTPPKPYAASGQPKPLGKLPAKSAAGTPKVQRTASRSYIVQPGDSLWSIANRHGTSVASLQSTNNLSGSALRPGQKLDLSGASSGVQVASVSTNTMTDAPRPTPAPRRTQAQDVAAVQTRKVPTVARQPDMPKTQTKPVAPKVASKPEPVAKVETAASSGSGFRWPVQGRIISEFGKKPNGERNDGIDLAVPEGTNVKAAESGIVIYAGNELKSYGNLVLVRHENGWVSAYAHNKDLLVKRGEKVKRGQVISRAGRTGGVDTPQVHFELRKGATPVDPMKHLSQV